MSTDATAVRTPADTQELTRRAIGTTFDLVRAAATDPSVAADVPNGATLILIPSDDPDLARAEIDQGVAAVLRGEDLFFRHVPGTGDAKIRTGERAAVEENGPKHTRSPTR